jgi:hypothetical protein
MLHRNTLLWPARAIRHDTATPMPAKRHRFIT